MTTGSPIFRTTPAIPPPTKEAPQEALAELLAGNARFAQGRRQRTLMWDEDKTLRKQLAAGPQAPIAAILGCCDSRTAGNLIFDQELGRLFSTQVAGGLVGPHVLASIEFAVEQFGTPLVLVLGHSQCGAVQAVVDAGRLSQREEPGALHDAFSALLTTLPKRSGEASAAYLARLARANARHQASRLLAESAIVRNACQAGRLLVVPAFYQLETGRVRLLHPDATPSHRGEPALPLGTRYLSR